MGSAASSSARTAKVADKGISAVAAQPSPDEVLAAAAAYGLADSDSELLWIVEETFSYIPEGYYLDWSSDNIICFFDVKTNEKQSTHPLQHVFQEALKLYRRALQEAWTCSSLEVETDKWTDVEEKPKKSESKWNCLKKFQGAGQSAVKAAEQAAAERKLRLHLVEKMRSRLEASPIDAQADSRAPSAPQSPSPSSKSRQSPQGAQGEAEATSRSFDEDPVDQDQAPADAPKEEAELPEGWKAVWCEEEQDVYYWHVSTNTVQWEPPEELARRVMEAMQGGLLHSASSRIQAHVRGRKTRRQLQRRAHAAVAIQKNVRGWQVRKRKTVIAEASEARKGSKTIQVFKVEGLDSDEESEDEESEDEDLMAVLSARHGKASGDASQAEMAAGDQEEDDHPDITAEEVEPGSNISSPKQSSRSTRSSKKKKKNEEEDDHPDITAEEEVEPGSNISSPQQSSRSTRSSKKKRTKDKSNNSSPSRSSNGGSPSGRRSPKKNQPSEEQIIAAIKIQALQRGKLSRLLLGRLLEERRLRNEDGLVRHYVSGLVAKICARQFNVSEASEQESGEGAEVRRLNWTSGSDFATPRQAHTRELTSDLSDILDTERAAGSPNAGYDTSLLHRGQQPYPAESQELPFLYLSLELSGPQARSAVRACQFYDSVREQRRTIADVTLHRQSPELNKAADFFDTFVREGGKTWSPSPQRSISPQRRSPPRINRSLREAGLDASWLQAVQALDAMSPLPGRDRRHAASPDCAKPTRGRRRPIAKTPAQVAADEELEAVYTGPVVGAGKPKGLRKSASDSQLRRQKRPEWQ